MASPAMPAQPAVPAEPAVPAARAVRCSLALRAAVLAAAAVCCGAGAWLGAWWIPFLAGVGGALPGRTGPRPRRGLVLTVAAGAVLGWLLVLWLLALDGQPVGATARTVAALAGLPPYAGVAVAVTLLLAALQVLAGAWLARAVIALRAGRGAQPEPDRPQAAPAAGDPQA
jgi:hypothetical protein